jgi:hypothetical protein
MKLQTYLQAAAMAAVSAAPATVSAQTPWGQGDNPAAVQGVMPVCRFPPA